MFFRFTRAVERKLAAGFYGLGRRVATRPCATLAAAVIFFGIFIVGWITSFEFESDGAKLYAPPDSRAQDIKAYIEANYRQPERMMYLLYVPAGQSILTTARLQAVRRLYTATYESGSFQATCSRASPSAPCDAISVGSLFGSPLPSAYDALLALSEPARLARLTSIEQSLGGAPALSTLLGGVVRAANGTILSARALKITYAVYESTPDATFKTFINAPTPAGLDFVVTRRTDRSVSFEVESAVSGDIVLVAVGLFLMIAFTLLALGKLSKIRSRGLLGLAAVFNVILSMVSGFGACLLLGIKYATINNMLIFLLAGIGVDDAFILVGAVDDVRRAAQVRGIRLSPTERVARALRTAGITITTTSLTDLLAFALGSISPIPAISIFCSYACVAIAFDWVLQITFFVACIALDERRAGHAEKPVGSAV